MVALSAAFTVVFNSDNIFVPLCQVGIYIKISSFIFFFQKSNKRIEYVSLKKNYVDLFILLTFYIGPYLKINKNYFLKKRK